MQKTVIYGLPLNPTPLLETLEGASFCISYATRQRLGKQLDQAIRLVGEDGILLVDNGAFSHWKSGGKMTENYIAGYEQWAYEILDRCPQAIAVYPDIIGGTESENRELIATSCLPHDRTMPIWHMNESIEYLLWMCESWEYVGIGSTVEFAPGSKAWRDRIAEVFAAIDKWAAESNGAYIRPRIHMMRAQAQAHLFDFDSSDSTNLAVNHNRQIKNGETFAGFANRIATKILNSADGIAGEHQEKRPLLGHVECREAEARIKLQMIVDFYELIEDMPELNEAMKIRKAMVDEFVATRPALRAFLNGGPDETARLLTVQ